MAASAAVAEGAAKTGVKVAPKLGEFVSKGIPGLGTIIGGGFLIHDLHQGKYGSALLDAGTMVPGVGLIAAGAQLTGMGDKLDEKINPSSVKSTNRGFDHHVEKTGEKNKATGMSKEKNSGIMQSLYSKLSGPGMQNTAATIGKILTGVLGIALGTKVLGAASKLSKAVTPNLTNDNNAGPEM